MIVTRSDIGITTSWAGAGATCSTGAGAGAVFGLSARLPLVAGPWLRGWLGARVALRGRAA